MDKKVLLVADDDEMNRKIISRFLKNSYEVLEAENGAEAWNIVQSTKIDALLLDIIMPQMNGLEVLTNLRERSEFNHIAVLVATSIKEKTERKALSLGADDIVAKPYDPIVIETRLNNVLAVKEIQKQKDYMEHGDFDALLSGEIQKVEKKAGAIAKRLREYTKIMKANKDNYKLLAEMLNEIELEADQIQDICRTGN